MASGDTSIYGRRKVIFFTDSRGLYLNELIKEQFGHMDRIEVLHYKSADIGTLTKNAYYYAESRPHDVLFIAGGICNITRKDPVVLARHIIDKIEEEDETFIEKALATQMAYCNLLGADLLLVLKKKADFEQNVLNEAIYMINEDIFQKNIVKGLFSPDLASPVHRKNAQIMSFLHHLASGGIHLNMDLKKKYAKKMYLTIRKYLT